MTPAIAEQTLQITKAEIWAKFVLTPAIVAALAFAPKQKIDFPILEYFSNRTRIRAIVREIQNMTGAPKIVPLAQLTRFLIFNGIIEDPPPEIIRATHFQMLVAHKVTMNDGNFKRVTRKPLVKPIKKPSTIIYSTIIDPMSAMYIPVITHVQDATAPVDRSIPPVKSTKVIPEATTNKGASSKSIFLIL